MNVKDAWGENLGSPVGVDVLLRGRWRPDKPLFFSFTLCRRLQQHSSRDAAAQGALDDGGIKCPLTPSERPQSPRMRSSHTWTLLTCPGTFSLGLSVFGQRLLPWTPHSWTMSGLPPVGPMILVLSANFRKGLSDTYRASADLVGFSLPPISPQRD